MISNHVASLFVRTYVRAMSVCSLTSMQQTISINKSMHWLHYVFFEGACTKFTITETPDVCLCVRRFKLARAACVVLPVQRTAPTSFKHTEIRTVISMAFSLESFVQYTRYVWGHSHHCTN